MSEYMLSDEDTMNDVNPFVTHDFSLPGGVRQMNRPDDFVEVREVIDIPILKKSVYCDTNLCAEMTGTPKVVNKVVHPRRNIDTGFTCSERTPPVPKKKRKSTFFWYLIIALVLLALVLLRSTRA